MNNQEFFEKTVLHLRTQGEKSILIRENGQESCKYRTQKGDKILMCAIGCHIPDSVYHEKMEGRNILCMIAPPGHFSHDEDRYNQKMVDLFKGVSIDLLERMQNIHDSGFNWEFSFSRVAKDFNLTLPDIVLEEQPV